MPGTTAAPPVPGLDRATRTLLPSVLLGTASGDTAGVRRPRTSRDWIVDVVVFVIAVGLGAVTFLSTYPHGPGGDPVAWIDLAGGLLLCPALWFRRRWPVGLALAATPFAFFASAPGVAGAILLFSLAVHRDARVVAAVAALQVPAILVYAAVRPEADMSYGWIVLVAIIALGLVVAWGMFVRARRQLVTSLHERAERAEGEQQLRVAQARNQERARIAREMHDVLAHRISLLSLHAGALEFRPDASPEEVAHAAGVIRASAHEALQDLREVIGVLRDGSSSPGEADAGPVDAAVRPQPGLPDLPGLLAESRAAGMRIDERLEIPEEPAPSAVGRTAYRVLQEGLTNARKHAWGAVVRVRVSGGPGDGLTVEVRTPAVVGGTAADPRIPGAGTGLIGLQERATLSGGRLESTATVDGGFLLRAWLPWAP